MEPFGLKRGGIEELFPKSANSENKKKQEKIEQISHQSSYAPLKDLSYTPLIYQEEEQNEK